MTDTEEGPRTAKVLDFGLVKRPDSNADDPQLSGTNVITRTPTGAATFMRSGAWGTTF